VVTKASAQLDWPKCDLCGDVMEQALHSGAGVVYFFCHNDDFTISFRSCRYGHTHCAWDMLHPIRGLDF
jgi:hypothetical protein